MKHLLFSVLVVACVGLILPVQSPAQNMQGSPEAAGITPISGDVVLAREKGNTHRFAAAWPGIMPNGQIVVAYPVPSDTRVDERAPFVDILDRQGNVLDTRPAFVDDEGNGLLERDQFGDDTRGIMADASRSGASMYVTCSRLQPWKYQGPLESWGSGATPFDADSGTPVVQIFAADGTALSPIVNVWRDDLIADSGDIRGRHAVFLSNGNVAFNFWDRKLGSDTGLRWIDVNPAYETTGNVVGIVVVEPDGTVVLEPTPISAPDPNAANAGAQSMRGMAAGDGWFSCRLQEPAAEGSSTRYKIFDNAGNLLQDIDVVAALEAGGLDADTASGVAGGRGDSELPWGQGAYLYTIGGSGGHTYVAKWDAVNGSLVKVVQASQNPGFAGERMDVCADPSGNVFAMWGDQSLGGAADMEAIGRFFDPDLNPVTDSFAVFENANIESSDQFQWKDVSCRMDDEIVVATCHADGVPGNAFDGESGLEHVVRILESPFEGSSVKTWELY